MTTQILYQHDPTADESAQWPLQIFQNCLFCILQFIYSQFLCHVSQLHTFDSVMKLLNCYKNPSYTLLQLIPRRVMIQ